MIKLRQKMLMNKIRALLKSPWFWAVGVGYLVRIVFMPATGQHDVMFMPWMAHFINLGHYNLYAFLHNEFGNVILTREAGVWAPYPYGFYLFTSGWLEFLEKTGLVQLISWDAVWEVANPARYVFLFKTAYIPFDLCIGYLIYRVTGRLGLTLWAWSPVALYTPFMMGQNDIYATSFAVMGTYAASRALRKDSEVHSESRVLPNKWAVFSCMLLGVGSVFKIFPLILLPPATILIEDRWRSRLILLSIGSAIFFIASIPFIGSPAYITGVLFNPEGTKIFRQIQILGLSLPPFLLGYLLLLVYLIFTKSLFRLPHKVWGISVIVLAFFFLCVPAPFYWLIWLTPFVIGLVDKYPKMFFAWFFLQLSFSLVLIGQHRELTVALPIHLMEGFYLPNIPDTLRLTHPALSKILAFLSPFLTASLIASLLLIIWLAAKALPGNLLTSNYVLKPIWFLSIGLPIISMFFILTLNLFLARNLASQGNWFKWQQQTFTKKSVVIQQLGSQSKVLTGVRIRFIDATPSTILQLCLYRSRDTRQGPLECILQNTDEQVENRVLYFIFSKKFILDENDDPTVTLKIKTNRAILVLPFTTLLKKYLQFDQIGFMGSLDISSLSSFNIKYSFDILIIQNILKDPQLISAIVLVTVLVELFLGALFLSSSFDEK